MTGESRLKARLWVQANIRLCTSRGIGATVARRGDADAGAVLLKMNLLGRGFMVLTQIRTAAGEAGWLRGTGPDPVEEAAADAYIARQVSRDSDLWVLEIEDASGQPPFGGQVM